MDRRTSLSAIFVRSEMPTKSNVWEVDVVTRKGARDIIRGCHNRDKGTAENERLRNPKFIFSYPKNERLIFLDGRNAAQEEISTMRVG